MITTGTLKQISLRIAGDTVIEHKSVPMTGKLNCKQDSGSYIVLDVPKDFADSIYEAIKEEGMERPEYAPHISVMTDEEHKKVGDIEECGKEYTFTVERIDSVDPDDWDEMEKVWFVMCKCPDLEKLREKYGLTPLPNGDHEFHITIGVRPVS